MIGAKTGEATPINKIYAHLTHCNGRTIQLAVSDTIKAIKIPRALLTQLLNRINLSNTLWFKKHRKKYMLSKKVRSFQQVERRHCTDNILCSAEYHRCRLLLS